MSSTDSEKAVAATTEYHVSNPHHDFVATSHGITRILTSDTHVTMGGMTFSKDEFARAFEGTLNTGFSRAPSHRFGNPAPMGLCGFSGTLFIVSLVNLGTRGTSSSAAMGSLCMVYAGLIEILTGMWCIVVENAWGATMNVSFGCWWFVYGCILNDVFGAVSSYADAPPGEFENVLGFFFLSFAILSAIMTLLTLKSTWILFALMFLVALGNTIVAASQFTAVTYPTASQHLLKASGVTGLLTSFIGWYIAYEALATKENSYFVPPVLLMPGAEIGLAKASRHGDA